MQTRLALTLLTAALILPACKKSEQAAPAPARSSSSSAPAATVPDSVFLAAAPENPLNVKEAKGVAKSGDRVILRGRIGGGLDPFVENRAVFTLMDFALPVCSDNPDDKCPTPWDYCCEKKADILAHACTVQVVDAQGQPLKAGLKGVHNLKPMSEVLVVGKVVEKDDAGIFVVNAESMYVKQ